MICPACKSEMAYSIFLHGFICLDHACGLELEMENSDAELILQETPELVCA